ncbi:MAG TPA: hypothetical protein VF530_17110 [Planctomycetota bacterium]
MRAQPEATRVAAGAGASGARPVGGAERPAALRGLASGRGLVIALSGVDCAGKSTQRERLTRWLHAQGRAPVLLWTRAGYTPALEALKTLARRVRGRGGRTRAGVAARPGGYPRRAADFASPCTRWLWLGAALLELLWLYAVRVRLWRALGRVVICDRHLLDCLVDLRVNFPAQRVERRWLCRALRRCAARPDVALCLLIPPELSLERARDKGRFHWETLEVHGRRREAYATLCAELQVQVLDGTRPAPELAREVERAVRAAAQAPPAAT